MNKNLSLFKKFLLKFWYYTPEGESLYDFCKRYEILVDTTISDYISEARNRAMDDFVREVDTFDDKTKVALYSICFNTLAVFIFIRFNQPILPEKVIKKKINVLKDCAAFTCMMTNGVLPFWVFDWVFDKFDIDEWFCIKYFWFNGITENQKPSLQSRVLAIKAISDKKNDIRKVDPDLYLIRIPYSNMLIDRSNEHNDITRYIERICSYNKFPKEELELFFG